MLDLSDPQADARPLIDDFDYIADVVSTEGTTFYLITDFEAERKRLVSVSLESPAREHWTEIIGQTDDTLLAAYFYRRQVCLPLPSQRALGAARACRRRHLLREIELPGYSSIADACKIGRGHRRAARTATSCTSA